MILSQVAKRSPKTATAPDSRQPKHGDRILGHFEENASIEQPQSATNNSALQTAVNATEPRHAAGGATQSAAGEQVYDDAKRATSPAGTPKNGNEAAGAQNEVVEHATPEGSISPETPLMDLSDAIPATSGMELMDEQSRQALVEA
ncbi:hypothetical protein MY1884_001688 [Beauveria asiatica]